MTSRLANFTISQIDLLLDSLEACPQLVSGKLGGKIPTKHHQKLAWEAVAQKINEVAPGCERSGEQIRKKWYDMKYLVWQKASKLNLKFQETGEVPSAEESLSVSEKRALSIIGRNSFEPWANTIFGSSAVSLKLYSPVNVDFIIENSGETDSASTSENNAKEVPDYARSNNVTQGNLNKSLKEMITVSENVKECNAVTIKTEDTSNEASNFDWPNKIIIQEIRSEPLKENASNTENDNSTERSKAYRARKRKLIEEEEDSFEQRAIATQERMATDISEIKMSMIEMNNNMKRYMERIDQKFDKMLDLLAVALNVEPEDLKK